MFQKRLSQILGNINAHSRDPKQVTLLAVTKKQPLNHVLAALEAGIFRLGVNYVQEGKRLAAALQGVPSAKIEWHFIGHIQSNKIKDLDQFDCVQSLDRLEIAQKLNQQCTKQQRRLRVLLEVNVGQEPTKSGIAPQEVAPFLEQLKACEYLIPSGLMCLPPALHPVENRRPFFSRMQNLYQKYKAQYGFEILSMGTSEDYLIALQEGSTMLRLGKALFGPRGLEERI